MSEPGEKPLLTFVVFAFRHERLVREAVEAALAQTYSPLEIILSDDCSPDRTFEIMKAATANYCGPHKIVLNRNPANLGLAGHVNAVLRMARGDLIVASAGDDVSLPQRTARIFEAWDSTGRKAPMVHSRIAHIDDAGKEIDHPSWRMEAGPTDRVLEQPGSPGAYVDTLKPEVFGCAGAYVPTLFKTFGDLPDDVIHEDNVITLRSLLLGRIFFVDAPLVKYRLHGNNLFNAHHGTATSMESVKDQENRMRRGFANRASMYRAFGKDLSIAHRSGIISAQEHSDAIAIVRDKERIFSLESAFMESNVLRKAWIFSQLVRAGVEGRQLRELFFRLLPTRVFWYVKLLRGSLSGGLGDDR